MPFTHVEVEEHKTRRILLLFGILTGIYVTSILALVIGIRAFAGLPSPLSAAQLAGTAGVSLVFAGLHWLSSTHRLVDRVLVALLTRPLDPNDTYHQRLRNIVEEVGVATGGRYRIEPYVISTTAMNACAVADFQGRAAIAVTEGLLARLSRAQLESVIGHEAAHIASGDSLANSIFIGLFALHEEALKRLTGLFGGRSGARIGGRGGAILVFVIVVLWLTNASKRLCEMALSREQEYRADAVAVRLTRNPLALAESLRLMERHWRGVGTAGESLGTLFTVDPGNDALTEAEHLGAELFSTHPPTDRRVDVLLGMAHLGPAQLERALASGRRPRALRAPAASASAEPGGPDARWFLWRGEEWSGPFAPEALAGMDGVTPESWVRREGEDHVGPAYRQAALLAALQRKYRGGHEAGQASIGECPNCRISLTRESYEGVPIDQCPACGGCYVKPDQLMRVMIREDYAFPESVKRMAQAIPSVRGSRVATRPIDATRPLWLKDRQCALCGSAVSRKLYSLAYLVEVEQCWICGLTWLDRGELELMQYLYEEAQHEGRDPLSPLERP